MDKLRIRFRKTGRAIYISHLDLMHTMQRGFSRAGYKLAHSEGFNPHPIISIALPLSVGTASVCEIMDFRLQEDADLAKLPHRLTEALPEGIEVIEVYETGRKAAELKWLQLEGRLEYDDRDPAAMAEVLSAFFARDSIVITKKSKKGFSEFDIIPAIREILFEAGSGMVLVRMTVSAQEPTFNPDLIAETLRQKAPEIAPDFAVFQRIETYDADMRIYR